VPAYQTFWPAVAKRGIVECLKTYQFEHHSSVLEVGVGTGLSLASYPTNIRLTGVDLSESMLREAQQLADEKGWDHVQLQPMNAEQLLFPDSTFDVVTSFHTITVVSNPRAMMSEMVRVCKPGGRLLIINHFRSNNPWIARFVDSAGNITRHLGWRTDLAMREVLQDLPLRLDHCYKPNPLSLFTVMKATCKPEQAA
jgi:phosphatidylethanolamine/phosphatidyl-N-methylethanolamine N-methyltransferase